MCPSPSVGRQAVKVFRLSDVPIEIRLKAAERAAAAEARRAKDPWVALIEVAKLTRVAENPELAAIEMADECGNRERVVALDEWERATNPRRRW